MVTPFGTLYSPNISSDKETGIGEWTAEEFYRMLHEGKSRDGSVLYPAMPLRVVHESHARRFGRDLRLPAIDDADPSAEPPARDCASRSTSASCCCGWRTLFFREGEYQPDPTQSAEWNRGAYLVEGLGHCTMCHTAINALGGNVTSKAFEGGLIPLQNWYAPSLTSNKEAGLGDWSIEDIVGPAARGHLEPRRGVRADGRGRLRQLPVPDRGRRARDGGLSEGAARSARAKRPRHRAPPSPKRATISFPLGKKIYDAQCAVCHAAKGQGKVPHFPPLANNQSIEMNSSVNPIRMVLNGGYAPGTIKNPMPYGMPPFAQSLSDVEVAAVVTYIRTAWGNHGAPVTVKEVNELRSAPLY